jgi:hypothetical protein
MSKQRWICCVRNVAPPPSNLSPNYEPVPVKFEEGVQLEFLDNVREERYQQRLELPVTNVSGRYQEQSSWTAAKEMRIHKIGIFRDYDAVLPLRHLVDLFVRGAVAVRQIQSMDRVSTASGQPAGCSPGQLGVDQKVHGFTGCSRRELTTRAAYAVTARKSSGSKSA